MSTTGDLARRFSAVYTGALTDVLDRHGYRQQTLPADIVPLRPGMRLAGPVYPVLGRAHPGHDYDTSIRKILEMLGSVPTESVAVYETNERTAAHFGELSATSLASRGCAGAVLDGGARDTEYILREDFPVFHVNLLTEPYSQWTEALIPKLGESKEEWEIFTMLGDAMGLTYLANPAAHWLRRALNAASRDFSPRWIIDGMIRTGTCVAASFAGMGPTTCSCGSPTQPQSTSQGPARRWWWTQLRSIPRPS